MNRQLKILFVITVVSVLFVLIYFFVALNDYNYNLFVTLKNYWVMFLFPVVFFLLYKREKKILTYPIKKTTVKVINLQRKWVPLKHRYFLFATFQLPNNILWSFNVPAEIFNGLAIGQEGILSYREKGGKVYFVFYTSIE